MASSVIKLPPLHPGQEYVRQHPARFKYLAAGRRWRKTSLCMTVATDVALSGRKVLWGAPTFNQTMVGWEEMQKACREAPAVSFKVNRHEAWFPNGGRVFFRSLNLPDNARGLTADLVILDECPLIPKEAWYEVIRPVISDTMGNAILCGTPKGRNWWYREFLSAKEDPYSAAWSVPTLGAKIVNHELKRVRHKLENPEFPFDELVQMFRTMPMATFQQEILAAFVDDTGGLFRGVMAAAVAREQYVKQAGHQYTMGVDWGQVNDWTVMSVIDATTREQVALDRFQHISYDVQKQRFDTMYRKFKPATVVVEQNAMGIPLVEELADAGYPIEPFVTTNPSKKLIIDALALAIEKGTVRILPDQIQIEELQAFEQVKLPSGFTRYQAPDKGHDDTVMALAMAYKPLHDEGEPLDQETISRITGGQWYAPVLEEDPYALVMRYRDAA